MTETTIIKSFVMLGKTVPEPTSERQDQYVCSAGWAPDHGLVRLYPFTMQRTPKRWETWDITAERHPGNKDSRPETWKPVSGADHEVKADKAALRRALEEYEVSGMTEANERRMSLAVVRPVDAVYALATGGIRDEPTYPRLTDETGQALKAKERFPYYPRMRFSTVDGRPHDVQYREWGMWELLRKNHEKIIGMGEEERVPYISRAEPIKDTTLLLIGNYARFRNTWLVIAALNLPFS